MKTNTTKRLPEKYFPALINYAPRPNSPLTRASKYGQASSVPTPPPWYGLVGVGGGGGAGVGGNGRKPWLARKPFGSRIPYNIARAPVFD